MDQSTDHKVENNTLEDTPPVFSSWNHWYAIVVLVNIIFVAFFFYYFKTL